MANHRRRTISVQPKSMLIKLFTFFVLFNCVFTVDNIDSKNGMAFKIDPVKNSSFNNSEYHREVIGVDEGFGENISKDKLVTNNTVGFRGRSMRLDSYENNADAHINKTKVSQDELIGNESKSSTDIVGSESQNFEKISRTAEFVDLDETNIMGLSKSVSSENHHNSVLMNDNLKDLSEMRDRIANGNKSKQENQAITRLEKVIDEFNNVSSLEEILDVYNPHRLSTLWKSNNSQLNMTEGCKTTMNTFLIELKKGTLWARKMTDASGRYTAGFYWGNNYWVGSSTLCTKTGDKRAPSLHSVQITNTSTSPFPVGFYTLRLEIVAAKEITPKSRQILLGICLPAVCNEQDVRQIIQISTHDETNTIERSLAILKVRTPQDYYDMTQDPIFWILLSFTVFVFVMLFSGTVYDLYLQSTLETSFIRSNLTHGGSNTSSQQQIMDNTNNGDIMNNNDSADTKVTIGRFTDNNAPAVVNSNFTNDKNLCVFSKIMLSFSVRRNMNTICDRSVGSDTIPTIHGLRSISMAWVILGHTCLIIYKFSDNTVFRELIETNFLFQGISNGPFSVDTFFFISGLLVSFLYFRTTAKIDIAKYTKTTGMQTNLVQFVGMITYRFARLTVPYMYVLGVLQVIMKWFYFNSVFEAPAVDHINCQNYWWRNMLYINTLFPVEDMCMLWSWYLADDTQFYVIGIVLLIMAVKHFRVAAAALVLFMVSSWCTTGYIAYSNDHMPNSDDPLALFDKIYDKPWTRLGPYLVGMSVGWILFKTDCKIKIPKLLVCVGWLVSMSGLLTLVFGLYNANLHPLTAAAYSSLSHTAWALCLAWVVIACSTGYGGYVNDILSMRILYPFSRVTYCAYLIHPISIRVMVMRLDSPMHLEISSMMILYFGQVVCSYLMSFIVSLAFEAPIVSLLRLVSPAKQKAQ